jgi:inositol 1,4,5-triphosphate receptor type 1
MFPSTSAITFWQIELETELLDGETITCDDHVRLRHVVSRLYLSIDLQSLIVKLTADGNSSDTLFRFIPVVKVRMRTVLSLSNGTNNTPSFHFILS